MANYFVNLPKPEGRNSLLDLTPINNALSDVSRQNNLNRQRQDMLDERTYQRGRDAKQDARVAEADSRTRVEWFGKQAAAIERMQGPQRQAAWQRILMRHPDHANLPKEYLDPMTGPALIAAEAGQWRDPRDDQMKDAQLAHMRSQTAQLNKRADQSKYVTVNGRIVQVGPGGATEIYNSGAPAEKPPAGYRYQQNGNLEAIPGGPHDPSQPTTTVRTSAANAKIAYDALTGALDDYVDLVKKTGPAFMPGREKDALVQARRNIQLQAKELYNLGVLNGPDLALMDSLIVDPTINSPMELSNAYDTVNRVTQGVAGFKDKLRSLGNARLRAANQPELSAGPEDKKDDPLGIR